MNILVTGGAGYIGSHMVKHLHARGHQVITFDNLSTGHRDAVQWGRFVEGDVRDTDRLISVLRAHSISAVMHFAASSQVGESVRNPALYYDNNVGGAISLLKAMATAGINHLVFSSTAAVYGNPQTPLLAESHPLLPINPYGWSKRMIEQMLLDHSNTGALRAVALRYFNAAGADASGALGERHDPETHLIPLLLAAAASGEEAKIFGDDYDTPDGTCIRDYIHVQDLCQAHAAALDYLVAGGATIALNLGTGRGYSVREVVDAVRQVTGCALPAAVLPRRAGDPSQLVAKVDLAAETLGWRAVESDLNTIISHAWQWHQQSVSA